MCFSATASFTASALLLPVGLYCAKKAYETDKRYLVLATVPFLFGIQQAFEGGLWLAMGESEESSNRMALGFLFFADFLWPFLVPLASAFVEKTMRKRRIFLFFSCLGGLFGLSLYLPLLFQPDWLSVAIKQGSILYQLVQVYDAIIPQPGVRIIYVIIVAAPLLASSVRNIRVLGVLLVISILVSTLVFSYAFVSVWCFFAAIISLYVFSIIAQIKPALKQ
jgi:hypothetical protein